MHTAYIQIFSIIVRYEHNSLDTVRVVPELNSFSARVYVLIYLSYIMGVKIFFKVYFYLHYPFEPHYFMTFYFILERKKKTENIENLRE